MYVEARLMQLRVYYRTVELVGAGRIEGALFSEQLGIVCLVSVSQN